MNAGTHHRRRVAYVVKTYPRLSETFILNEILELERRGMDVTILALKRPAEPRFHEKLARVEGDVLYAPEVRSNALIDFLGSRLSQMGDRTTEISDWFWDALRRSDREALEALVPAIAFLGPARERRIEHLHAHFATSAAGVAQCLGRLLGIGYSFTAHAKDIFHESVDRHGLAHKIAGADFVVAISDWSAAYLEQAAGSAASAKVHRIYNGIDLQEFPMAGMTSSRHLGLISSVGRLVPKKGFPVLVEAMAILKRQGIPARVEIAGEGESRPLLEALIRRLGLEDVVLLRGAMSHDRVRELLSLSSVFVLPAEVAADGNRDGLPVVIVEAMAAGVPVISTPVVGIPEAIEDGVTGLLVPERDPEALARAIRRVLEDKETTNRLVRDARGHAVERFDIRNNVEALQRLLEQAISARNSFRTEVPPGPVLLGSPAIEVSGP